MLFAVILIVIALQVTAVFLAGWCLWPNILPIIIVLFACMLIIPAVIWVLRKKGHQYSLKKWQDRFLYVLFLAGTVTCLAYMLYAAGYEIFDPQISVRVNFIIVCLGFDSCYLDYLQRKSRRNQRDS